MSSSIVTGVTLTRAPHFHLQNDNEHFERNTSSENRGSSLDTIGLRRFLARNKSRHYARERIRASSLCTARVYG